MIKLNVFLTRRNDISHAEFLEYWTQKHTPMLSSLPPGAVQVSRYVQLDALPDSIPGFADSSVDGVAELWLDGVEDGVSWFTSEAYLTQIAPDEENFLDRTKTRILFAEETAVFG